MRYFSERGTAVVLLTTVRPLAHGAALGPTYGKLVDSRTQRLTVTELPSQVSFSDTGPGGGGSGGGGFGMDMMWRLLHVLV